MCGWNNQVVFTFQFRLIPNSHRLVPVKLKTLLELNSLDELQAVGLCKDFTVLCNAFPRIDRVIAVSLHPDDRAKICVIYALILDFVRRTARVAIISCDQIIENI